ncbi:hypothetical protein L798_00244 [Zootermopsis nevadensis]|uniref:Uncharacterized protein n=1 Tax=Zootermopsis nevadensis TaxID=136037 RepID=A0A067QU98_ZOONE|nr:hypothetical protein L798_00244 [Zootermopsis nevadensis]
MDQLTELEKIQMQRFLKEEAKEREMLERSKRINDIRNVSKLPPDHTEKKQSRRPSTIYVIRENTLQDRSPLRKTNRRYLYVVIVLLLICFACMATGTMEVLCTRCTNCKDVKISWVVPNFFYKPGDKKIVI